MEVDTEFESPTPVAVSGSELVVNLEGFEGPIDLLLALARHQKVDLIHISILQLADQYLAYIAEAKRLRLEVAADYLVMAAWLAYLKSRLLVPEPDVDDEPSGPEMAEALAFQLRRLEAMQQLGAQVIGLPRLGYEVFPRGAPEGVDIVRKPVYELSLYQLLKAYGEHQKRTRIDSLEIAPTELFSMDDALERLGRLVVGRIPDWQTLSSFLPHGLADMLVFRSAVAATLAASLELVRSGRIQLRQPTQFGPIYVRSPGEQG